MGKMKNWLLIVLCILFLAIPSSAADVKITQLPENIAPTSDDLAIIVDSPGVDSVTQKVTLANLTKAFGWVDSSAYTTIELANTAAYNAKKLLVVSQNYTLTGANTLTASVMRIPGGSFTHTAGSTLALSGSFQNSDNGHCFIGFDSGDVTGLKEPFPEWFGALGDDSTDDYLALTQWAGSIPATGSSLKLSPNKIYRTSAPIVILSKNNLTIDGQGSTIKAMGVATAGYYYLNIQGLVGTYAENVTIKNLSMTHNRAVSYTSNCGLILCRYINNVKVYNNRLHRSDAFGIYVANCNQVFVHNNDVGSPTSGSADYINGAGIIVQSSNDIYIHNNFVSNVYDDIIVVLTQDLTNTSRAVISGNTAQYSDIASGIRVLGMNDVVIKGNIVGQTRASAIAVDSEAGFANGCNYFTISDNVIRNAGQATTGSATDRNGIQSLFGFNGTITGNVVYNPKGVGINVQATSDIVIKGNSIICDADNGNQTGVGIFAYINNKLIIDSNNIFNPSSHGIAIQSAANNIQANRVINNLISNARKLVGGSSSAGIHIYKSGAGDILNSFIDGNTVMDTRGAPVLDYNIWLEGSPTGVYVGSMMGLASWAAIVQGGTIADWKLLTAGRGIILKNAAGTVTKRVRLNNVGDGLIYEAE